MSYVVLARKYRPRSFEQMVGQSHVVRALTHALAQQRLHHAYLFTGTRGIGKTTVSRILAKSLNCIGPDGQGGVTAHPCGVCSACTEIDADRYVDYIEMDAASNRGIDEIRDLLERAAYKPSVGRFKVFMIDEAHQLTKESFNALLKTLEEPPEYLKFVLATTDPEKMLPTVLSRCLQFNLRPMAPEVVYEHLQQVLQAEGVAHDEVALRLLARAARGSMRDGLSLTDQAIAYGGGAVEADTVRQMLGAVDRSHAAGFVEALARRDGPALLAGVDALRERGLSAAGTLDEMARLLQQMALEQAVPGALDETDPETPATRALAALLPPDETQFVYSLALHGRGELSLAPDDYAALTMVLLRLFAFAPGGGAPAAPPAPKAAVPAASAPAPVPASAQSAAERPAASAALLAPPPQPRARVELPAAVVATDGPRAIEALRVEEPVAAAKGLRDTPSPRAAAPAAMPVAPARSSERPPAPATAPETAPPRDTPQETLAALPADAPPRAVPPRSARPAPAAPSMPEPPDWLDAAPPPEREEPAAMPPDVGDVDLDPGWSPARRPPRRAEAPEPAEAAAPVRAPAMPPAPAVPLQTTPLGDRWTAVVRGLNERQAIVAMVRELAMQAELVAIDEAAGGRPTWRLRVERESLRTPSLRDKLQAAIEAAGETVQLAVEAGVPADSVARRDAFERERRQKEAEQIILNDPVVQDLMARFPTARIVPGSIKPL